MSKKIRLHGTRWCPDTARSRRCLERLGIEYDWVDIEKDIDACAFVQWVNKGNRSVPTLLFPDGTILVEPSDEELEKKVVEEGLRNEKP